jgi:hypothetical protein
MERWTETATVYNLTVTDIHTYYVIAGSTPVLVHNTAASCPIEGHDGQPVEYSTAPIDCTCPKFIDLNRNRGSGAGQGQTAHTGQANEINDQRQFSEAGVKGVEKALDDAASGDPGVAIALGAAYTAKGLRYLASRVGKKLKDWWEGRHGGS